MVASQLAGVTGISKLTPYALLWNCLCISSTLQVNGLFLDNYSTLNIGWNSGITFSCWHATFNPLFFRSLFFLCSDLLFFIFGDTTGFASYKWDGRTFFFCWFNHTDPTFYWFVPQLSLKMERERRHKNYFSMRKYNKGLGQDCDAMPSIVWKYFVFALLPEMPRLV